MTPQEQRDQEYLNGYGVGLYGPHLSQAELVEFHSIAFARGYREGREDRNAGMARFVAASTLTHARPLPIHRTEAGYPRCATCDGGGCFDCTDPA